MTCKTIENKAIRDGKYLAPPHVLGNIHPIKIENFDIFFRDGHFSARSSLLYFLFDRATQEVPMKNIWNKLSVQFLRYTPLNC